MALLTILHGKDVRLYDDKSPPGFDHPSARDQLLASTGCQQVDLHLCGQNFLIERHKAESGVPCRAVSKRKCQTGMGKALLLQGRGRDGGFDLDRARVDFDQTRAQCCHQTLFSKAGLYFRVDFRIKHGSASLLIERPTLLIVARHATVISQPANLPSLGHRNGLFTTLRFVNLELSLHFCIFDARRICVFWYV